MSQLRQAAEVPWPERAAPLGAHKAADNLRGMPVEDDDDDDQLVTFRIGDQHVPALSSTEALAAGLNKPGSGGTENHVTTPHKPSLPNSAAAENVQRPHRFKSPAPSTPTMHTHITTRRRSFIPPPPSPLQSLTQRSSEVHPPAPAAAAASQSAINRGTREVTGGIVGDSVEGGRHREGDSGDACQREQQQHVHVAHPQQRQPQEQYHDHHRHDKQQQAQQPQQQQQQPQQQPPQYPHHSNPQQQQQPQPYSDQSQQQQQQQGYGASATEVVDQRSLHSDVPVSHTQQLLHYPYSHQQQQPAHRNNSSPPPTTDTGTDPLPTPPGVTTHTHLPTPPIHDEPLPPPPQTASSTSFSGLTRTPVRAPPLLSSSHSTPSLLPSTSSSSGFKSPLRTMMNAIRRRVPGSGGSKSCPPNLTPLRRHAAAAQEAHASTPHAAAAAAAAGGASVRDKVRQIETRRSLQSHATTVQLAHTHAQTPSSTQTHAPHTDAVSGGGSGGNMDVCNSAIQGGTSHGGSHTSGAATQSERAPTDTHTAAVVGLTGGAHRGVRVSSYGNDTHASHEGSAGSNDREGLGEKEGASGAASAVDTEEDDIGEKGVTDGAVAGRGACGAGDGDNVADGAGTSPRISGRGFDTIDTAVHATYTRVIDTAVHPSHTQAIGTNHTAFPSSDAGAQSHTVGDAHVRDRLDSSGGDGVTVGRGIGGGGDGGGGSSGGHGDEGDGSSGGIGADEGPSSGSHVTGHNVSGHDASSYQHALGGATAGHGVSSSSRSGDMSSSSSRRGADVSSSSSGGHGSNHVWHGGASSEQHALSGAIGDASTASGSNNGHGSIDHVLHGGASSEQRRALRSAVGVGDISTTSSSSYSGHGNNRISHSGASSGQHTLSGTSGGGVTTSSSSNVHGDHNHISDGGVTGDHHTTTTEVRGRTSSKIGNGDGADGGSTNTVDMPVGSSSSTTTGSIDLHDGATSDDRAGVSGANFNTSSTTTGSTDIHDVATGNDHTGVSGADVNDGHLSVGSSSSSSQTRGPDREGGVRGGGIGNLYADWAHVSPSPSTTATGSSSSREGPTHTDAASHTQQPTSATVTATSSSSGKAHTHVPLSSLPGSVDGETHVSNPPSIRNWLGFLGNGALSPNRSVSSSISTNQAETVSIPTNGRVGAGDDGTTGHDADRGAEEEDAGQCTNEGQDAGEQDGPTRRLSAGLSMRYEAFSQAEVDMIVNRRLEEERVKHKAQMEQERSKHEKERGHYQAQVQELESRASEAEVQAQNSQSAMEMMEALLAEQLDTIQQSFHQRIAETQKELQHREIQLKALSSQAVDHSTKMEGLQQDLDEANRRLGAADVEKMRLVREYEDKLEHAHSQRDQAVSQEVQRFRTAAQKKFDWGNAKYTELEDRYKEAVKERDMLRDECEDLRARNAELSQTKAKLDGYVKKLEDDLVAVRVALSKKDEDIAAVTVSLESRASEARAAADRASHEAAAATQDRDVAYQSLSRITVQLAEAKSNFGALQARVRSLQTDNSELEGMCASLMERCEVLQQENDVLKQQLQQYQQQQQRGQQA